MSLFREPEEELDDPERPESWLQFMAHALRARRASRKSSSGSKKEPSSNEPLSKTLDPDPEDWG